MNYTSNNLYLAQSPVLATFLMGNIQMSPDEMNKIIGEHKTDLIAHDPGFILLAVRETSKNKYGIFSDKHKVKDLVQHMSSLEISY